jgi:signal transduction histidine kinase
MYLATIIYRGQQENQREELDRSNKVKNGLISIISHDLRAPIVSLKQLLDYAEQEELSEQQFKEYLQRLNASVNYTSDMIDKVLFWANNQMKGMKVQKKKFSVEGLVEEVLAVSEESANQKGIEVELRPNGGLEVEADPQMIRLVMINVINNAIKFSPVNQGKVEINITKKQSFACVDIQDNGKGMDDSQMKQLFSLEKTVSLGTDGEKGAGIGMVLSKELITMNKGDIIPSSEPGKGTSICLKLPLAN